MMLLIWVLAFFVILSVLAYQRAVASVWLIACGSFLILFLRINHISWIGWTILGLLFVGGYCLFSIASLRKKIISLPILKLYRKMMPTMSRTEQEALSAGTVDWEGDLFSGAPDWDKLLSFPEPMLTEEEEAFLAGPVETLCKMTNDWDITHNLADLPPEVWEFLKREGFFALIIPKTYGGKEFSAYAHSQILVKIYGRSTTLGSTVAVPNSLGPAELILHYGTDTQKNYYLPRLATGEEVPCFALTGPEAGSDAGAMTDTGIVCWGEFEGKKTLGIKLNWNKRYITLAPVATVIGLAFKLYDPDQLLGNKKKLGITCALIPRNTPGITIGRRHFPANIPFQNGPTQGKDVFIPVDWIIGGAEMAGHGWRMLMECLAAGRAISLPSSSVGGAKMLVYATGAYARVRRQFSVPIGLFEGVEEVLAKMAGLTYIMDAVRCLTVSRIDNGQKPAVASAITKYHTTELGRKVANDAMDVHGGKGICLGPRNYVGRFYQAIPIAITVEGANILTRNMIIFGQGVMRCHPYILAEYEAANMDDQQEALAVFDKALMGHLKFVFGNLLRSLLLSLSSGRAAKVPDTKTKRYFQQASRFSAAFALLTDVSLLVLGGSLKRKESISARLGDILSELYLLSAVLKHYQDQGSPADDLPIVDWACQTCLYQIQERFNELLKNFPSRWLAGILRVFIFPWGQHFSRPNDKLGYQVATLLLSPTESRARLSSDVFVTPVENNPLAWLNDALSKVIAAEPIEKIIKQAEKAGQQASISPEQLKIISEAEIARQKVVAVDDFAPEEL